MELDANTNIKNDTNSQKLKFSQKISYGFGNLAANLLLTTANAFISYFYTESVGITVATVGIILLAGRVLDGIADIAMGMIVDKTKSKYGKARPWLLRMAIPYGLAIVLLFSAPAFGESGKVVYALVTYLFAMFIFTGINVPYNTLMALETQDQKERSKLSSFRTAFGFLGALAVNMITMPIVSALGGGKQGWFITAIIYGVISILLYLNCFKNSKEINASNDEFNAVEVQGPKTSLKDGIIGLFKNKYWVLVIILILVANLNSGLGGVNVYYAQYILGDPNLVGLIGLASFLPIIVGVLLSGPILVKFGKRNSSIGGAVLTLIGCGIIMVGPSSIPMVMAGLIIKGLGAAPMLIASYAMLGDTIEYGEWKNGTRAEGLTFSAASFGEKVGTGLGGAVLGGILAAGGYIGGQATQSASAITSIKFSFVHAPIMLSIVMIVLLIMYKLDAEYPKILAELKERKGNK
ncbi:MFS transporter [Clostridium saccharoperbutylacetonicum]